MCITVCKSDYYSGPKMVCMRGVEMMVYVGSVGRCMLMYVCDRLIGSSNIGPVHTRDIWLRRDFLGRHISNTAVSQIRNHSLEICSAAM